MSGKKTRIMYIECKTGSGDRGQARIGRVSFSASGKTIYYNGRAFQSCAGQGISGNYFDVETGDEYWISGPKRKGGDRHWAGGGPVRIDADIAGEYWASIRNCEPRK
ncbi:MAG: 1-deoxy-D-xylulose-5-phosphate synthase, partial [Planctomycetota bacterium]